MKLAAAFVTLLILLPLAAASSGCIAKTMTYDQATKALNVEETPVDLSNGGPCVANLAGAWADSPLNPFTASTYELDGCVGAFGMAASLICFDKKKGLVVDGPAAKQHKSTGSCNCPAMIPSKLMARMGAWPSDAQRLQDIRSAASCPHPYCNGTVNNAVELADYSSCAANRDGDMCMPTCQCGTARQDATGFTLDCDESDNSFDGHDATLVCPASELVCHDGPAAQVQTWPPLLVSDGTSAAGYLAPGDLDAVKRADGSLDLIMAWNLGTPSNPDDYTTYSKAVSFTVPPGATGAQRTTDQQVCANTTFFTPVTVTCLTGLTGANCNMPSTMYTGTNFQTIAYNGAYGLVDPGSQPGSYPCDWIMDAQAFSALYVNADGNNLATTHGFDDSNGNEGRGSDVTVAVFATRPTCTVDFESTAGIGGTGPYTYGTIDGAAVPSVNQAGDDPNDGWGGGCNGAPLTTMPCGWEVVPGVMATDTDFINQVARAGNTAARSWGTLCVVLGDGEAYDTESGGGCGSDLLQQSGDTYGIRNCDSDTGHKKRVLIRRRQ